MKKLSFKRGCVMLLLMATGFAAYAGVESNIPPAPARYGISVAGLFLMPGAGNLQYATYTEPLPAPVPTWKSKIVDPNFSPGFELGFLYTLASKKDQIKVDWLYLNTSDTDSGNASGSASIAPPYYFGPTAQDLFRSSAVGSARFNINSVNVVFDHIFNVGKRWQVTPYAGVKYAHLKQSLQANYQGFNQAVGGDHYDITAYNTSTYDGAGPRLGIDTTFYAARDFGVFIGMGASIMAGSVRSKTNFTAQGRDNTTPAKSSMANQSVVKVVPEIDSKLGMVYQFNFKSGESLAIEAGYLFAVYIDGITQVMPTALVPGQINNGVVAVETSEQDERNMDINGPYLKVSWLFG